MMVYTEDQYEKFEKQIKTMYPKMYGNDFNDFCIGPGWWPIIEELSCSIQDHLDWENKFGKNAPQVSVDQVKEKFGGLRFYYSGGDRYVAGLVDMAERMSERTCEVCGKPGRPREGGWIKTLCDEHARNRL